MPPPADALPGDVLALGALVVTFVFVIVVAYSWPFGGEGPAGGESERRNEGEDWGE